MLPAPQPQSFLLPFGTALLEQHPEEGQIGGYCRWQRYRCPQLGRLVLMRLLLGQQRTLREFLMMSQEPCLWLASSHSQLVPVRWLGLWLRWSRRGVPECKVLRQCYPNVAREKEI